LLKNNPALRGLNVTLPYKQSVITYLDALSPEAEQTGAVNCISIKNSLLKGYNTDAAAFENSLKPLLKAHHTQALILGNGGAAQAVKYALQKLQIPYHTASRNPTNDTIGYAALTEEWLQAHPLLINTTPLGMYPRVHEMPAINYDALSEKHLLYDLVYNPETTLFLAQGKAQGAAVKNGLEMLHLQAEESWRIWNQPA
jgi:shikimate dehydrogenase